jgi:DNA-binding XRE family transcriptional regulator
MKRFHVSNLQDKVSCGLSLTGSILVFQSLGYPAVSRSSLIHFVTRTLPQGESSIPSWNNPFWSNCQMIPMRIGKLRWLSGSVIERYSSACCGCVRIEAELIQAQLAKILGVTQARVSKYEQGERRIDMLDLKAVCDAIKLPLTEFVRRALRKPADDNNQC